MEASGEQEIAVPLHDQATMTSLTSQPAAASVQRDEGPRPRGFRTDIQGLRAVAVSLVLVYHLWPQRLSGGYIGVDVFFVISGFLMTSHLLGQAPRNAGDVVRFWARRVRRLLPASLLVLFVSLLLVWWWAPDTQWLNNAEDIIASALYVENWRLAETSVDYLAGDNLPTVAQHYWSLSVEEQFYFVWPILVLLFVVIAGLLRRRVATVVCLGVGAVVVASFVVSLSQTNRDPARAYFVTPTRIWELGVGGLLACGLVMVGSRRTRVPGVIAPVRGAVALGGLAVITLAAMTFSSSTAFPGWRALVPVVGTVGVIVADAPGGSIFPGRFLALPPVQFVGDISYSLYLWHWPLIVLVPFVTGRALDGRDKLVILALCGVLAWLTKRYVEDPFRVRRRAAPQRRVFQWAALGMACVVAASGLLIVEINQRKGQAARELDQAVAAEGTCFGAEAMAAGLARCEWTNSGPVVPAPAQAPEDRTAAYGDDCWEWPPFPGTTSCVYGDPGAPASIALVGNSHAGHWLPALEEIAERNHIKITTFLASGCTVTAIKLRWDTPADQDGCWEWGQRVVESTTTGEYDLVVTSELATRLPADGVREAAFDDWKAGYTGIIDQWVRHAVDVVIIRDTPQAPSTHGTNADCIALHPDQLLTCSGPRDEWLHPDPLVAAGREFLDADGVTIVDMSRYFCTKRRCFGVIGGVTVFYDNTHMTNTFAVSLAPYLEPSVLDALREAT